MIRIFSKKVNKEKVLQDYMYLLEQKYYDDEILMYINELISEHSKEINFESDLVKINGPLSAIYRNYVADKQACISKLKKCSPTELKDLEEQMEMDDKMMDEISLAIRNEENARKHQAEIKKLEKYLTEDEIETVKNQYLVSHQEEVLKR